MDGQARTQLELSIGDLEMVHLLLANMAKEMWDVLVAIKESRGALGVLAVHKGNCTRRKWRKEPKWSPTWLERQIQSEIHLMGEKISED